MTADRRVIVLEFGTPYRPLRACWRQGNVLEVGCESPASCEWE
jgi:hypothetical protein